MTLILSVILVHWFADFVLQTHWQATNKSKNWYALLRHVSVYSVVTVFAISMIFDIPLKPVLIFLGITFVTHFVTDAITSRITARLYAKGDYHNFFVVIGFDQVLHYTQLFLTLWYLGGMP